MNVMLATHKGMQRRTNTKHANKTHGTKVQSVVLRLQHALVTPPPAPCVRPHAHRPQVTRVLPSICNVTEVCTHGAVRSLVRISPAVGEHFMFLMTATLALIAFFLLMGKLTWKIKPVFSKRDLKKIEEYRLVTKKIMETEQGLYDEYFKTLGAER